MKILIADDETAISEAVADVLIFHKYLVDVVDNGKDALEFAKLGNYDGIILDIMMPGMDGIQVLEALRKSGCRTPVMLLTAKTQIEDRIAGLDAGADDYLPKPFAMGELVARVRAMLRRKDDFTPDVITCADVVLNRQNSTLSANGKSFVLPKLEFRMMETFMINKGVYLSTEDLLTKVWGYDSNAEPGTVWVYISYLRKKLIAITDKVEITAKRNVGYMLTEKSND